MEYRITAKGILQEGNKVLFVEYKYDKGLFYSLPGGNQIVGESLEECLKREFAEETGIEITVGKLLLVNEFIENESELVIQWQKGIHQIEHIFLVFRSDLSTVMIQEKKDIGMTGLKWMSEEELTNFLYYPKMECSWFFRRGSDELIYNMDRKV